MRRVHRATKWRSWARHGNVKPEDPETGTTKLMPLCLQWLYCLLLQTLLNRHHEGQRLQSVVGPSAVISPAQFRPCPILINTSCLVLAKSVNATTGPSQADCTLAVHTARWYDRNAADLYPEVTGSNLGWFLHDFPQKNYSRVSTNTL
jgi:hypothetical protein